MKYVNHRNDPR